MDLWKLQNSCEDENKLGEKMTTRVSVCTLPDTCSKYSLGGYEQ